MADQERKIAPLLNADSKTAIPGEYIVILKKNADLDANIKAVEEISAKVGEEIKILGKFTTVMNGFTIKCGEKVLEAIRAMEDVDYVEANQTTGISDTGALGPV